MRAIDFSIALILSLSGVGLLGTAPVMAGTPQSSAVYAPFGCTVGDDCNVVGASQLVRDKRGVTATIWTTGLEGGGAYTVWWVIFNDPAACAGPCDGGDLGIPKVKGSVIWATGQLVGSDGFGNLTARLREADTSGDRPFDLPGDAVGLIDARKAEIHLVVRSHGPVIPELVYEQVGTFAGACDVNACEDQQFAVHR